MSNEIQILEALVESASAKATAVEAQYSALIKQGDVLREEYAEHLQALNRFRAALDAAKTGRYSVEVAAEMVGPDTLTASDHVDAVPAPVSDHVDAVPAPVVEAPPPGWINPYRLTTTFGAILQYVAEHSPCTRVDVATAVQKDPQAVSVALNKLKYYGHVHQVAPGTWAIGDGEVV